MKQPRKIFGEIAISIAANPNLYIVDDFKVFAKAVKERTGGIPIKFELRADAIAISNSVLQTIVCIGMLAFRSINCLADIVTQKNRCELL